MVIGWVVGNLEVIRWGEKGALLRSSDRGIDTKPEATLNANECSSSRLPLVMPDRLKLLQDFIAIEDEDNPIDKIKSPQISSNRCQSARK